MVSGFTSEWFDNVPANLKHIVVGPFNDNIHHTDGATNEDVEKLVSKAPQLEVVRLTFRDGVGDPAMKSIVAHCSATLREVVCPEWVTAEGIQVF